MHDFGRLLTVVEEGDRVQFSSTDREDFCGHC